MRLLVPFLVLALVWLVVFVVLDRRQHRKTLSALDETYKILRGLDDEPRWEVTETTRTYSPPWPENEPEPCAWCLGSGQVEQRNVLGDVVREPIPCPACSEAGS